MLDLSKDHRISLKRHDRKLWSYQDYKPDVVEAAVLDYLRDHGCDGYFTQRDAYLNLFKSLAGWPGKISKRMPPGFVNPHFVYFHGSDGWLPIHKFSYERVMAEVDGTTIETLTEKLQAFCHGKTYSQFYFSGLKQQPDHMLGFLHVLGIDRLQKEIRESFKEEHLKAMRFLYDFDTMMLRLKYRKEEILSPEGLEKGVQCMPVSQRAFHRGGGFDTYIDQTEEFAGYLIDEALKQEVLDGCAFARKCREKTLAAYETTILDLQIWDGLGTAIVEVKAPSDRLSPSQKNTIEQARMRGERACVIYVDEA